VPDIGDYRAGKIVPGWAEQKAVRDIMLFLHSHGVGASRAARIFKTYGHDAVAVMTEDPYRLARDIRGVASFLGGIERVALSVLALSLPPPLFRPGT